MDAGRVLSPVVLEALAAASPLAPADADAPTPGTLAAPLLAREGLAERLLGPAPTSADPSNAPARHVEHGAETATVQTHARGDLASPSARGNADGRPGDSALPGAAQAPDGHALAADQLVPAALIGLQAQPAWTMPLPVPFAFRRADDEAPAAARRDRDGDADPDEEDEADDGEPEAADPPDAAESPDATPDAVLDPADDAACDAVARALQAWLAAPSRGIGAAGALSAILDQWQRGRCVVVACPHGADPNGAAWAFVLRLRRPVLRPLDARHADVHPADPRRRLSIAGRLVPARLQWRLAPLGAQWVHGRLAKDHHPQRGRQLVPLGVAPGTATPCHVQLGPVLAERRLPADVHLRIDAVRRFWGALGDQWSVLVVACSLPLAGRPSMHSPMEDRHADR
jgi:hypothetical protein